MVEASVFSPDRAVVQSRTNSSKSHGVGDDGGSGNSLKRAGDTQDRNVHIVIAENNAITRRMIEMAITSIGWTVDSAADGVEALLAVERAAGNLALVLANISMPKMTGIELAKAMREIPSLSRVPVVLMGPPEQRPEALAAGCSGFLAKPISMEALVETLNL